MTLLEWVALIGFTALGLYAVLRLYRTTVDSLRLDALQTYQWQVAHMDGEFAVLVGSPPKVVPGSMQPTVREAIDAAILERQNAKTQGGV